MTDEREDDSQKGGEARGAGCNLLIVEPEALLRWSLVTYLSRWFHVFPADSRTAADRILELHRIDALVVSDDLTERGADEIAEHAHQRNASIRVVHVVMTAPDEFSSQPGSTCIEKPFRLSRLAQLLGVENASRCSTR